ncbi:hypothetical protein A9Q84_02800 [Halobacteriovorax marinus]|uniref:Lipoprotein n=1 Tax=Halobacteriovorax marinus TaxID=97084 RepID=A0A1Y5FD22_9BACT|nr:hypothetical protein A9Q84_02800 [Halobacteriovorax marinus]
MKKLSVLLLSLFIFNSAYALSDRDCRNVYNDAFEELAQRTIDFNQGYSDKFEFSVQVAGISTTVSSVRALCLVIESPKNAKCVKAYKKRYKTLRNQIKLTSVLVGNQTRVNPRVIDTITSEFGTLFNRAKCGDL